MILAQWCLPACISAFINTFTALICVCILEFSTAYSEHFHAWLRMLINNLVQSLLLLNLGSISSYALFRSKEKQVNPLLCGRESRLWPVYTYLWHLFKGKSIFKSQPSSFHEEERKKKQIKSYRKTSYVVYETMCEAFIHWAWPVLQV